MEETTATQKRVCLRLKEARKQKNITLSELSKRTKISKEHLLAIEECRFDDLPFANIYKKNFIRSYCQAVGECSNSCVSQFTDEELPPPPPQPVQTKRRYSTPSVFHYLPNILRVMFALSLAGLLVGYLGLQVKHILEPPTLVVYTPQEGFITDGATVLVQGKTEKEAELSINGTTIGHNEDGQFREVIDVSDGVNTIVVTAKKKHGKTTSETRHVIVRKAEDIPTN